MGLAPRVHTVPIRRWTFVPLIRTLLRTHLQDWLNRFNGSRLRENWSSLAILIRSYPDSDNGCNGSETIARYYWFVGGSRFNTNDRPELLSFIPRESNESSTWNLQSSRSSQFLDDRRGKFETRESLLINERSDSLGVSFLLSTAVESTIYEITRQNEWNLRPPWDVASD